VVEASGPLWRVVAAHYRRPMDTALRRHVSAAMDSEAVRMQRDLLAPLGLRIDRAPVLWKYLPGPYLRLFFRVEGDSAAVEEGRVVALVLLHDPQGGRTLYAHTVHADPHANPLLKHLHGPMSSPKAQDGANGERATLRLLEHKQAIWDRFLLDRERMKPQEAGQLWRERYFWALVRLYFCERCPACRWGSPHFDGAPGELHRTEYTGALPGYIAPALTTTWFDHLRESCAWTIESTYVQRGGFTLNPTPALAVKMNADTVFVAFRTEVEHVGPGIPVGAAFYADASSAESRHAHVLTAGPEPELAFLHGDRVLGLPRPQLGREGDAARESYASWRRQAWSDFWLRELEDGLHAASRVWLTEYWEALTRLFGAGTPHEKAGQ